MFINYTVMIILIALFIGCLFISFYYGFRYASLHDFIRIVSIGYNEDSKDKTNKDGEEIRVASITDENTGNVICILDYNYLKYAEQIDNILNSKEG